MSPSHQWSGPTWTYCRPPPGLGAVPNAKSRVKMPIGVAILPSWVSAAIPLAPTWAGMPARDGLPAGCGAFEDVDFRRSNHRLPQRKSPGWHCRPAGRTTACNRHDRSAPLSSQMASCAQQRPAVGAPIHRQRCHRPRSSKGSDTIEDSRVLGYVGRHGDCCPYVGAGAASGRSARVSAPWTARCSRRSRSPPSPLLDATMPRLTRAADHSKLWFAIAAALVAIGGPSAQRGAARGVRLPWR